MKPNGDSSLPDIWSCHLFLQIYQMGVRGIPATWADGQKPPRATFQPKFLLGKVKPAWRESSHLREGGAILPDQQHVSLLKFKYIFPPLEKPRLAWLRSAGGRRKRTAGLMWGGSAGLVLEEPALRQECGECGSRRRPAAGINGSSPAPRAAPSSLGKGESCRLTPASSSSRALLADATGSRARMGVPRDLLCARSLATLPWLLSWYSWVLLASCLFADSNRSGPKQPNPIKI